MKAVITVTGKDSVGIIASVSAKCSECSANIVDITQTVLNDYFVMIMLVNIDEIKMPFNDFVDKLEKLYPEVEYVNRLMTHSWGQRVVRFYDPDGNLIEVGTPM